MNRKPLITKIKEYFEKTEEERDLSDYRAKVQEYQSMDEENFQSRRIAIDTKLDYEKSKFAIFISVILVAVLTGLTEKIFSFLKMVGAQMLSVTADKAAVLDGIYWMSVILYLIILFSILLVIWVSLRTYYSLSREQKIIEQAQKIREGSRN
jgi:hypothetical protein